MDFSATFMNFSDSFSLFSFIRANAVRQFTETV